MTRSWSVLDGQNKIAILREKHPQNLQTSRLFGGNRSIRQSDQAQPSSLFNGFQVPFIMFCLYWQKHFSVEWSEREKRFFQTLIFIKLTRAPLILTCLFSVFMLLRRPFCTWAGTAVWCCWTQHRTSLCRWVWFEQNWFLRRLVQPRLVRESRQDIRSYRSSVRLLLSMPRNQNGTS